MDYAHKAVGGLQLEGRVVYGYTLVYYTLLLSGNLPCCGLSLIEPGLVRAISAFSIYVVSSCQKSKMLVPYLVGSLIT